MLTLGSGINPDPSSVTGPGYTSTVVLTSESTNTISMTNTAYDVSVSLMTTREPSGSNAGGDPRQTGDVGGSSSTRGGPSAAVIAGTILGGVLFLCISATAVRLRKKRARDTYRNDSRESFSMYPILRLDGYTGFAVLTNTSCISPLLYA